MSENYTRYLCTLFSVLLVLTLINNCTQSNQTEFKGSTQETNQNNYSIKTITTIGIEEAQTEEDKPYQFAHIYSIDCDGNGSLYALDGKDHCVKVFDQTGKFLRQMFQKGEGPNETYNPKKIIVNKYSNTLFLLDEHGYRLKQFDINGNPLKTIHLPEQFFSHCGFLSKRELIYVAKCKYGENSYDNFKVLDVEQGKIKRGYAHKKLSERQDFFNQFQQFVVRNELLWTSLINETDLIALDLNTGKLVRQLSIPGNFKKNRIVEFTYSGYKGMGVLGYNYIQPLLLEGELFALLTVREYDLEKEKMSETLLFPKSSKLRLYRIVNEEKVEKVSDLESCDFMELQTTYKNRIILSARDPYPHIKIIEVKKVL